MWILTGDKAETSIYVAKTSGLIDEQTTLYSYKDNKSFEVNMDLLETKIQARDSGKSEWHE